MGHVRVSDSMNIDVAPKANADICICVFVNVSKDEDREDQLVDWFVSATIQTATKNKQSAVLISICFFAQLLLKCVPCFKMSCAYQRLQL